MAAGAIGERGGLRHNRPLMPEDRDNNPARGELIRLTARCKAAG
jgi:hypothetical protein